MYFTLSKKYQKNDGPGFNQLGLVIADSIEQAVEKVGLSIVQGQTLPDSPTESWVEMENNYHLKAVLEWDGKLYDTLDGSASVDLLNERLARTPLQNPILAYARALGVEQYISLEPSVDE